MARTAKLPKYSQFNQQLNCYGHYQQHDHQLTDWLTAEQIMLEVGAGSARLATAFAQANPDWQVLAIDRKSDRLLKAARQDPPANIAFLQTNIDQLNDYLDLTGRVSLLWLTFPDPYPRLRSAKHRLSHPNFLAVYRTILTPDGKLRCKTDDKDLFDYSLAMIANSCWLKLEPTCLDLHQSQAQLPAEARVVTSYEEGFLKEGRTIFYLEATKTS